MARYLLAATPMPGHADPVIAAAAGLVQRGHEVVVHTGRLFQAAVERIGARFAPLAAAIDIDYRDIDARFPERASIPAGAAQMLWGVRHIFADAIEAQHHGLVDILAAWPAEAILADMMFLGTLPMLLGPRERRPVIAHLGISTLALSAPEVAFFGSGLPPARTPQQRLRNEAVTRYLQAHVFASSQSYVSEVLGRCGAGPLPCFLTDAVVRLPDAYLQIGVPSLEYSRSNNPPGLRFIGVLPARAAAVDRPAWWPDVAAALAAGRPIVMVTQGTIASADLGQLVRPTLQALGAHDVLVIAITSGADPAPLAVEAPPNARVVSFIPYADVLPHVDLLITNGGFGGVLMALSHGVPLLVAGDSEEKPEIAERVAYAGVGINLGTGRPSPALIASAVDTILDDQNYYLQAMQVADEIHAIDGIGMIEAALAGQREQEAA